MTDIHNRTYIIKFVTGEMCDQEIIINLDANLVIIGEENSYKADISDEGFTTYSIPSHQEPFTFSVISYEGQVAIDLHTKNHSEIIPIKPQQVILKELFPILIKHIDTPWEEPIIIENIIDNTIKSEKSNSKFKKSPYSYKLLLGMSIFISIFISFIYLQYNSEKNKDVKIQSIENIIIGNHHPVIVTEGNKDSTLILVRSQRDLDWSMQHLLKSKFRNHFYIKKINDLESEIEGKLAESISSLLKIDVANPCNPIIKLLSDNISEHEERLINSTFSGYFKCYTKSEIKFSNTDELIKKAELGLTESNVKWHKISKNNRTIFIVKDSLNDKQTISLITFASAFYKQWGERQIQFSISLANNELAGKSFITNSDGYVLLGNNHWLFNSKIL